ncbi:unnamed protein product [Spirodela intermedia]|uniref:Serine aminopeptidase S33 domain-containing protein n=1 Tax=Spirodela intermedia TaxID=51605 RepID=A0A7I8J2L6_SPIIN|nr:unnamed protein product [Spirodela intermedia]CAA6663570.1 unnamed protein product [Spirodela intermedia]
MEQLVNFIIRPQEDEFTLKGRRFQRKDLQVKNIRGNVLQCSHYLPLSIPEGEALPCVIYCHGNSGCRADASEAAVILLPSNITVFTLDFSGSGLSEGEHVTLGWNEKEDLRAVVNYLRTEGNVSFIGLWGRSMGAVTSLMYGAEDPSIAGMVLDSPFSNLVDLMMELVDSYKYPLPKFTVKLAIQHMRRVIKKKANFDIMDLDAIQVAKCCFVPALLGHATDDDFIRPHHSDLIYDAYEGDKNIIKFDGDHNSPRPQFYFDSITIFFHNVLNPPEYGFDEHSLQTVHDYIDQDNWETVVGVDYRDESSTQLPSELGTNATVAAINLVRIRRPMSRTEDDTNGNDVGPSSSQSTSFDLSNGHSHGSHMPSISDDGFVTYSFDALSDVPSTMEEEERMLMEAVMESLRDLEIQHTEGLRLPAQSSSDSASNTQPNELPTTGGCSLARSPSNIGDDGPKQCSEEGGADEPPKPAPLLLALPSGDEPGSTHGSAEGPMMLRAQQKDDGFSSSEHTDDISARTQATIVVQKNPSGNPLDGLMQRWGSFFRNNK